MRFCPFDQFFFSFISVAKAMRSNCILISFIANFSIKVSHNDDNVLGFTLRFGHFEIIVNLLMIFF